MGEGTEYGWEMANALPEAITVLDRDGRVVAGNAAWGRIVAQLRLSSGEARTLFQAAAAEGERLSPVGGGCSYLELCHAVGDIDPGILPDIGLPPAAKVERPLRLVQGEGGSAWCEYTAQNTICSATFEKNAASGHVIVTHRRLREKTPFERARENEAFYFSILNKSRDGVFLCDNEERLLFANAALCRWMGKECSTVLGRAASRLAIFEMDRVLLDANTEVMEKGATVSFEISAFSAQGICTFSVLKMPHRINGSVTGVVGIVQDITGERAMEREMIAVSDREKQRLGQELHENLCQYLVGISLLANVLYEDLVKLGLKQGEDARQITGLVKDAISEVRALAKGLAPLPQEHGEELLNALHELVEQARSIGKVKCILDVYPEANAVPSDIALHLFRIAQEAVHNAIKHASASMISLSLQKEEDGSVVLRVEDDGEGMHARSLAGREEMGSGLGLHMMKYRSRAIGAELEFQSRIPRGTTVTCTVPGEDSFGF